MELFCWLLVGVLLLLSLLLAYGFSQMDCDLELLLYSIFGRPLNNYQNKVVWITGASSGIGEHLAYVLAKNGAKLVLSGRDSKRLEEVKGRCLKIAKYSSSNIVCLAFDMVDIASHEAHFDTVLKHFERLDILVCNAGRSQRAQFVEIDYSVDKALFDVNVFSLVNLSRIAVRYFLQKNAQGQIAVTSSTAGLMGVPGSASYTGSKHALHGYFEGLRNEVNRSGIGITLLCPGPIFSNILQNGFTGKLEEKVNLQHRSDSKRMPTERCAELMAIAIINRMEEAWMALQPILTGHYLSQYQPWLFRKLAQLYYSPERVRKLRDGL